MVGKKMVGTNTHTRRLMATARARVLMLLVFTGSLVLGILLGLTHHTAPVVLAASCDRSDAVSFTKTINQAYQKQWTATFDCEDGCSDIEIVLAASDYPTIVCGGMIPHYTWAVDVYLCDGEAFSGTDVGDVDVYNFADTQIGDEDLIQYTSTTANAHDGSCNLTSVPKKIVIDTDPDKNIETEVITVSCCEE